MILIGFGPVVCSFISVVVIYFIHGELESSAYNES